MSSLRAFDTFLKSPEPGAVSPVRPEDHESYGEGSSLARARGTNAVRSHRWWKKESRVQKAVSDATGTPTQSSGALRTVVRQTNTAGGKVTPG